MISSKVERPFIEICINYMKKWFVYIAEAKTGRLYVGITNDPKEKIKRHNSGRGAKFCIDQGPFKLVYISEAFDSKSDVRKREIQIKKWSHNKKEKLIQGAWV